MRLPQPVRYAFGFGIALIGLTSSLSEANAAILGPIPYKSAADSPFDPAALDYFYLEDFEDAKFNVPGVTADRGGVASVVFGPSLHDSVDGDDGAIDGSGLKGDSYFATPGFLGVRFTFDATQLGSLPTVAGIVWTDGSGPTTFEAFGPGNISLGSITVSIADNSVTGETDEDHFFGVQGLGPIESIFISNSAGGIEVDHLQYGLQKTSIPTSVPEPGAILGCLALGTVGLSLKRKQDMPVKARI